LAETVSDANTLETINIATMPLREEATS